MEDLTGKQFGPYQIVAPLGEGGMAAVYKAYQPAVERYVALKVLPRHFAEDAQFVARFQREAKLLAQLQHLHILPVFDFGQADGYTYIVMPFVESGTLTEALKGQPLPLLRIRQVISQIGDALNYAHARGLIHRDIKPSNILMDAGGNCLLADFGLARMVEASVNLTNSGAIMGTPAYMSPEQGSGQKIDARSDLYSLGVILFEMAVGRVPYRAETPIAVIFKHIQDPLPLARELNPQLPEAVELVILKALSKSPTDRYQTAGEMVQAIQLAIPDTVTSTPASVAQVTSPNSAMLQQPPAPTNPRRRLSLQHITVLTIGFIVILISGMMALRNRAPVAGIAMLGTTSTASTPTTAPFPTFTQTPTPSHTPTVTHTPTPSATASPRPTKTATPPPAWVTEFSQPILDAIAARPPNFQDDFDDRSGDWQRGWCGESRLKYQDGELVLTSCRASRAHNDYADFVAKLDGRFLPGITGDAEWSISFRESGGPSYTVRVNYDGSVEFGGFGNNDTSIHFAALSHDKTNQLLLIAKGSKFAFYINDMPLYYVEDSQVRWGDISFRASSGGSGFLTNTPTIVAFDNFMLWDISDISIP